MKRIKAKALSVYDEPQKQNIISVQCTFPMFLLRDLYKNENIPIEIENIEKKAFSQIIENVFTHPFVPFAWKKEHAKSQDDLYITNPKIIHSKEMSWLAARDSVLQIANELYNNAKVEGFLDTLHEIENTETSKQLCTMLLEPFMWVNATSTAYENDWDAFLELNCPKYKYKREIFRSKKSCITSYTFPKGFVEDKNYLDSLSELQWLSLEKTQGEVHMMYLAEAIYDAIDWII